MTLLGHTIEIFAPRTDDVTETTILSPIAGAPHSDPFRVSTLAGVAGHQPYLAEAPRGGRGPLDPIEKRIRTGTLVARVLDPRVSGGAQGERWVSAFGGDAKERNRWIGLKARAKRTTDGVTYSSYFTGRIESARMVKPELWEFTIREALDDLDAEIFVGNPPVSYATSSVVMPRGFVAAHGTYGPFRTTDPVDVGILFHGNVNGRFIAHPLATNTVAQVTLTKALEEFVGPGGSEIPLVTARGLQGQFKVGVTIGVSSGLFDLEGLETLKDTDGITRVSFLHLRALTDENGALDTGHADYLAAPAGGTSDVSLYIYRTDKPTPDAPLFLDDVDPIVALEDALAGQFGRLKTDGTPAFPMPMVASTFTALKGMFPNIRIPVLESGSRGEWSRQEILKPLNLGLRTNGDGELELLDLREPDSAAIAGIPTITDTWLAGRLPTWEQRKSSAITAVEYEIFLEELAEDVEGDEAREAILEFPRAVRVQGLNPSLGDKVLSVPARGFRAARGEQHNSVLSRADYLASFAQTRAEGYRGPYAMGAATVPMEILIDQETTTLESGDLALTNASVLPDPVTNERGGTRLLRIISRREDGPKAIIQAIDLGVNTVTDPPTVGAIIQTVGDSTHSVTVQGVVLNADGTPVVVELNVTDTTVTTRPGPTDPGWQLRARTNSGGSVMMHGLPSGRRIWARLRSVAGESEEPKRPSAWVFPTGAGRVDLAVETPPTSVSASNITAFSADLTIVTANADLATQVFLDGVLIQTLGAGVPFYQVTGLAASTQYDIDINHVDLSGGPTAQVSTTFSTTASAPTAPSMLRAPSVVDSSGRFI